VRPIFIAALDERRPVVVLTREAVRPVLSRVAHQACGLPPPEPGIVTGSGIDRGIWSWPADASEL